MIKLSRLEGVGWVYTTPNGNHITVMRNDNVTVGYWGRYQVGSGRKAHYFDRLKDVRVHLYFRFEHFKVGDTVYLTHDINKAGVVREVRGVELICDEWLCDEYSGYEFKPTGDTISFFTTSDDMWKAPEESKLGVQDD